MPQQREAAEIPWSALAARFPQRIRVVGPAQALREPAPSVPVPPQWARAKQIWPEAIQSEAIRPGAAQSEAIQSEAIQSEAARASVLPPEVTQPDLPGLRRSERRAGWQLAQRVWQEAGVEWEEADWAEVPDRYATRPDLPVLPTAYPSAYPSAYPTAGQAPAGQAPIGHVAASSVPLGAPVMADAPRANDPDEMFRAWQGSVRQAVGGPLVRRRPGRGPQAVKIGVPAAVIVAVGATALLMLTGRANGMLAERASSAASGHGHGQGDRQGHGQAQAQGSGAPGAAARSGTGLTGLTLVGYPGEHGSAGAAALWSGGGVTLAVGYADNHPAVWRHVDGGTWSLVSAAGLGGLTGHLTSVARGPSGWLAVGSMRDNGTVQPAAFWSPDGRTWTRQPALTGLAGSGAQFLGVAAGAGGYLVVGKEGSGSQEYAALWWSADLKNWVSGGNSGDTGSYAAAAVAVGDGFAAVGSQGTRQAVWTSPDGRQWTASAIDPPSGAGSATLRSVTAGPGGLLVAAGFATGDAGDVPVVVTSADGGARLSPVVLGAPQGPAAVTAVTAAGGGFTAVGLAGPADARRAVEWTSPDGRTWSAATPVPAAGSSEITALTDSGGTLAGTEQQGDGPAVLAVKPG